MDKETMEYLDQKHVGLARKEDLEKLRQETKASFRQMKEENKTQFSDWTHEINTTLEASAKQWKEGIVSIREEILKGLETLRSDTESGLRQSHQRFDASFQNVRSEAEAIHSQSKGQMDAILKAVNEEGKKDLLPSLQEARSDLGDLKAGLNRLQDSAAQLMTEVGVLNEKVRAGTVEVKEELGAMIKFSFADLERKLNALEARIQVLEKIVLQQT